MHTLKEKNIFFKRSLMKKRVMSIVTLGACATLCAGLLMGACQGGAPNDQRGQGNYMGGDQETQGFYRQLSPENQRKFDQLDARGKANAVQIYRENGSRDANRAVDSASRNQRSKFGSAEKADKAEVVAAPAAPAESKPTTAATDAEKIENKVSSATSTATTTVQ